MKKSLACVVFLIMLAGCTAQRANSAEQQRLDRMESRMQSLEDEVRDLREATLGIRSGLDQLQVLLKEMRAVQGTQKPSQPGAAAPQPPKLGADDGRSSKSGMDKKAEEFANESLDRFMDISRKILDRLEQELDKGLLKKSEPADKLPE